MHRYFLCIIAVLLVAACKKEQYATGVITMTTAASEVSIGIISLTDAVIDWGDGEKSDTNTGEYSVLVPGKLWITHSYSSKSVYRITITGNNIVLLDCSINQLTTLDVSCNIRLTDLICYSNQLTTLDVSRNPRLAYLDCASSQLTTLDVSRNPRLAYLDCANNQLTTLNVSRNPRLAYLNCSINQLTTLDVSRNTELKHLSCPGNQLRTLNVRNTELTNLSCSGNQLTTLDVSCNPRLAYLDCPGNQLRTLDMSRNTELKYLSCPNNKLTTAALNDLFRTLHNYGGFIFIWDNPGASDCDFSIAEGKGWNVYRYM